VHDQANTRGNDLCLDVSILVPDPYRLCKVSDLILFASVVVTCRTSSGPGRSIEGGGQCPHRGCRGPRGYFASACRSCAGDPTREGDC
jgi:hypothetical protein